MSDRGNEDDHRMAPHGVAVVEPVQLFHVNINVSDMDRSVAFYERLGFVVERDVERDELSIAAGLGLPAFRARVVYMKPSGATGPTVLLDLVQFRDPLPVGTPYESLNHLGIGRLAFAVRDIEVARQSLDEQGIAYMANLEPIRFVDADDWAHPVPVGFLTVRDPDGTYLQLVAMDDD